MISSLSSLIEFLVALYASICIDEKFKLNIWKPTISSTLSDFLEKNPVWEVFSLVDGIKEHINSNLGIMYHRMRRLSALMLIVCAIIFLYMGFEDGTEVASYKDAVLILSLTISFELSMIFINAEKYLLLKSVIIVLITVAIFAGVCVAKCIFFPSATLFPLNEMLIRGVVCIDVIMPILYMMAFRIMIKKKYFIFAERCLCAELERFALAKEIAEKKRPSHDPEGEKLPQEYLVTFGRLFARGEKGSDTCFKDLAKTFMQRFKEACIAPPLRKLCSIETPKEGSYTHLTIDIPLPQKYGDVNTPVLEAPKKELGRTKMEKFVQHYIAIPGKRPPIKKYCIERKLDFAAFLKEYKKQTSTSKFDV